MTLTRSQIERLGARLVRSDPPAADDLGALHELLLEFRLALEVAVARVQRDLGTSPSSRVKTTGTILEKLDRYGGSWLKSIQDLAGMRIVGAFDRREQDAVVAKLVELFADGARPPKMVDRRAEPSHGYRAVHVIVFVRSFPVEIQVRTALQHGWAELFEKLADLAGRRIRYGDPPAHWLTTGQRDALPRPDREFYDLSYEVLENTTDVARLLAERIDVCEQMEVEESDDPSLQTVRNEIDFALERLTELLNSLALLPRPMISS